LIQLNPRFLLAHIDRDDIEPTRTLNQVVPRQIVQRDTGHPSSLEQRDRLRARAELTPLARLDLDEDDRLTIARDDIQFSSPTSIPAGKYFVPSSLKLLAGQIFA
jgi:hypothetical protein